jgi:hypothetical protein
LGEVAEGAEVRIAKAPKELRSLARVRVVRIHQGFSSPVSITIPIDSDSVTNGHHIDLGASVACCRAASLEVDEDGLGSHPNR